MAPRTILAALLLAAAVPASAEFCWFNGESRSSIELWRLKSPRCTMENQFVFDARANENRYGPDVKEQTVMTGSWPGWGGADQKCAAARRGADKVLYGDETYILGKVVLGGHAVWSFAGDCEEFRRKFDAKRRELGESASYKKVFEAAGAEESDMGTLVDRLIEGKKPKKKD